MRGSRGARLGVPAEGAEESAVVEPGPRDPLHVLVELAEDGAVADREAAEVPRRGPSRPAVVLREGAAELGHVLVVGVVDGDLLGLRLHHAPVEALVHGRPRLPLVHARLPQLLHVLQELRVALVEVRGERLGVPAVGELVVAGALVNAAALLQEVQLLALRLEPPRLVHLIQHAVGAPSLRRDDLHDVRSRQE